MAKERQLTFGEYGHTLNRRQAISADGQWAVYDTRNDDSHIARTEAIEMVHLDSGEIVRLYQAATSSLYGPGVGAVAFHPHEDRVVFIHGLESCTERSPYSAARRFGAIVELASPGKYIHAEARVAHLEDGSRIGSFGLLSGGTHAHSWSDDGWLSFTYNDAWLERTARVDKSIRDLRSVGFMSPGIVNLEGKDGESFGGSMQAFLAASLTNNPRHGSDDIEQALEECWIGKKGYLDARGVHHPKALAFLGAVRNDRGEFVNEIFVSDIGDIPPRLLESSRSQVLKPSELLTPAPHCQQRRLTRTAGRKFPGVQGLRNWLVSSPDGKSLFAPMRDDNSVVQLHRIDTANGNIDQVTRWEQNMEGQIAINSAGTICSNICGQRVCLTHLSTGKTIFLTERNENALSGAVHFVGEHRLAYNRVIQSGSQGFMQVMVCELE